MFATSLPNIALNCLFRMSDYFFASFLAFSDNNNKSAILFSSCSSFFNSRFSSPYSSSYTVKMTASTMLNRMKYAMMTKLQKYSTVMGFATPTTAQERKETVTHNQISSVGDKRQQA